MNIPLNSNLFLIIILVEKSKTILSKGFRFKRLYILFFIS